jgi:hypothetical protein
VWQLLPLLPSVLYFNATYAITIAAGSLLTAGVASVTGISSAIAAGPAAACASVVPVSKSPKPALMFLSAPHVSSYAVGTFATTSSLSFLLTAALLMMKIKYR